MRYNTAVMLAEQIRDGMILLLNNHYQKVLSADLHKGSATAGMMIHAKLRNIHSGAITEQRWAPTDKVQEAAVEIKPMQFLYTSGEDVTFMDPQTYEQITLTKKTIGPAAAYLAENMLVPTQFDGEKPLAVQFPEHVEIKVTSTGAGFRGQGDTTFKPATLENGIETLVPQFIETGDVIRVEVETGRYLERLKQDKFDKSVQTGKTDKKPSKTPP